ncbi:MAG: ferritin [bacterium]
MINEKIEKAFNEQIKHELDSAYLYLSMAAFFHRKNLDGMAAWMQVQAKEEYKHAMKFFDHIRDRDGRVHLQALGQPTAEWGTPLDAWKAAYKHEQFITQRIHELMKLAQGENDYSALPLLNWFLDEQIEEESQTLKVVQDLEMAGTSAGTLLMLDKHLGKREE